MSATEPLKIKWAKELCWKDIPTGMPNVVTNNPFHSILEPIHCWAINTVQPLPSPLLGGSLRPNIVWTVSSPHFVFRLWILLAHHTNSTHPAFVDSELHIHFILANSKKVVFTTKCVVFEVFVVSVTAEEEEDVSPKTFGHAAGADIARFIQIPSSGKRDA